MDTNTVTFIGILASLIVGISGLVWQWYREKHPSTAEKESTSKTDIDASASAATAIKQYSDEIIRLRGELKDVNKRVSELEDGQVTDRATITECLYGIRRLLAQMDSLGITPVWKPSSLLSLPWSDTERR